LALGTLGARGAARHCGGSGGGTNGATPLAEQWTGSTWQELTTPDTGSYLSGISCPSASDCIAVEGTLAEQWNGTAWQVLPARPRPE
jgi:hypothetical protein